MASTKTSPLSSALVTALKLGYPCLARQQGGQVTKPMVLLPSCSIYGSGRFTSAHNTVTSSAVAQVEAPVDPDTTAGGSWPDRHKRKCAKREFSSECS